MAGVPVDDQQVGRTDGGEWTVLQASSCFTVGWQAAKILLDAFRTTAHTSEAAASGIGYARSAARKPSLFTCVHQQNITMASICAMGTGLRRLVSTGYGHTYPAAHSRSGMRSGLLHTDKRYRTRVRRQMPVHWWRLFAFDVQSAHYVGRVKLGPRTG